MAENITEQCSATKEINGDILNSPELQISNTEKHARKKSVSFQENVTDIDTDFESSENLPNSSEEDPKDENLSEIFNVSEKINFFKNAFSDQSETKDLRSLGHQTSIPEARLAFVTGMVQSPSAGSCSRVEQGRDDTTVAKRDDEDDTEMKRCFVVSVEVPIDEKRSGTPNGEMMATTLTYSKIFPSQKNIIVENGRIPEAVVDTSSILEHREELRELWEKRMMADENQSSSSSTAIETDSKPLREDESEEKVVKSDSELQSQEKMPNGIPNGYAKHSDVPDTNANHIHENAELEKRKSSSADADQENNNSADSLEEDNTEDFVEQKTYTSNMEEALVMTAVKEVTSSETIVSTTIVQEVCEIQENKSEQTKIEVFTSSSSEGHHTEVVHSLEGQNDQESSAIASKEECIMNERNTEEIETAKESVEESTCVSDANTTAEVQECVVEVNKSTCESVLDKLIIPDVSQDDDDGFVRVEECLPKDDNADEPLDLPGVNDEQNSIDHDVPSSNGFEEQSLPVSPVSSTSSEKVNQPEMEQFVKSGGVKRIIPGVQKTEQPYSSCTTETKIAMEIREMREREEELRIMREQSLLSPSPVVSPVPPKTCSPSVRTPSPSPKESPSPILQGPGYRVSSVFGHRGISPAPSIEEERKPFNKTMNKESAVEKEIRLAKDREEELRKQKGLPPREDDSYVKPSQVKSSQVRVFGKMAGTNSSNIKQAATAKIQMEIEEQTQREMALREMGHIQTISQERTDAKVAKLKTAETAPHSNGTSYSPINGNHTNGRTSPDASTPYKRSSPSPTNARPASIFAQNNNISKANISMHKFINSKGKETTFSSPRNGPFQPKEETVSRSVVPPPMVKLKRTVSVESKIQQEIMEMKMREEELRKLHLNVTNGNSISDENDTEHEMNQKNNLEYENGNGIVAEEISPRHNKLIAQWEQRIQKAES